MKTQLQKLAVLALFNAITFVAVAQPRMVKNIGYLSGNANPGSITYFNGKAFFTADDNVHGANNNIEMWSSDASYYGTSLLKDINTQTTGNTSSSPASFIIYKSKLYFTAKTSAGGAINLWVTDGTLAGTQVVGPGYLNPISLTIINSELYFSAGPSGGLKTIYKYDGTTVTQLTTATLYTAYGITQVGSNIVFTGDATFSNQEVWILDISAGGASQVKEINTSTSIGSDPSGYVVLNSKAYFSAAGNGGGKELWVTDGTAAGTTLIKDINPGGTNGSNPSRLTLFNSKIYFIANDGTNGVELWSTDGTGVGTTMVIDLYAGSTGSNPDNLIIYNSKLYFAADHATLGREIFSCSTGNTVTNLKDIATGSTGSSPNYLEVYNSKLYFAANDNVNGSELWSTNGTPLGTAILADIVSGATGSSPANITACGNNLFFSANDGTNGRELWVYNPNTPPTIIATTTTYTITCGNSAVLTATGASTYNWISGSGASISVTPTVTTVYAVEGISANGAVGTDTVKIKVIPSGGITIVSSAGTSICGNTTSGTFSATGVTGGSTYDWGYYSGGYYYPYSVTTSTMTKAITGTIDYGLITVKPNGCVDTTVLSVIVHSLPTVAISPGSITICSGTATTLTASGAGAGTYTWSTGTTGSTASVAPTSAATYTVTGTDIYGCSKTAARTVNTNPLPVVSAIDQDTICGSGNAYLGVTTNLGTTLTWYTHPTSFSGSIGSGTTISTFVTVTDTFYVDVYYTSTLCRITPRQPVIVTVKSLPNKTVTVSGNIISSNETGAAYQWKTCTPLAVISGATNQSYVAPSNGQYKVMVTKNGCVDSSACSTVVTGIYENKQNLENVSVYPNPANNQVTISRDVTDKMDIQLIDVTGKLIFRKEIISSEFKLDVSDLMRGIYLLRLNSENKTSTTKLVIQ